MSHLRKCLSWRCRYVTGRTVMWLAVVLTSGFLLGSLRHEADVRAKANTNTQAQLCGVVINVHRNDVFLADNEADALQKTRDYLADPDSGEVPALRQRIKQNLPSQVARAKAAAGNAKATRVPPVCKPYVDRPSHTR